MWYKTTGRGGNSSSENSHPSSCNRVEIVDVDGRNGYRSYTRHSSLNNPGGCGIFLSSSVSSCPVEKNIYGDDRVGYIIHDDSDKRGDRIVDNVKR